MHVIDERLMKANPKSEDTDHSYFDVDAFERRYNKKRDGMVKNWIDGKKRSATAKKVREDVCEATVESPRDIIHSLQTRGWSVIMDYNDVQKDDGGRGSIFSEGNVPTAQQALYYETGPDPSKSKQPPRVPIFEGVKINSGHGSFESVMSHGKQSSSGASEVDPTVRQMMKPSRSKTSTFQQYQDLYLGQMHDVVESMFESVKGKINPGTLRIGYNRI
jgi:hypothetical protein